MSILPDGLENVLGEEMYKREGRTLVQDALIRLGVNVSDTFQAFYARYSGPFWEERIPFELLDLADDKNTIESYTFLSRQEHAFPTHYLVLSEMSANAVLVLDTVTDHVYIVNFEGDDEQLIKGELKESWPSFFDFLKAYFDC